MIVRVTNLTNGNLSINILRVGLAKGETKDIEMKRKVDFTAVDGSTELADLISAGKLTLVVLEEIMEGYVSPLTSVAAGATVTFTHNLNVDCRRMLVDLLGYNNAGSLYHKSGVGVNAAADQGIYVSSLTATTVSITRTAADATSNKVCVRIAVAGMVV